MNLEPVYSKFKSRVELDVAKALMRSFERHGVWGTHHWREDTLPKGFPKHLRGLVLEVAEKLRRAGFLVKFPTNHGVQWHANFGKREQILEFTK